MSYNGPEKTWTNEPLIASDLNAYLRDNTEALKNPPGANNLSNEGSDYSTASTSFVAVDSTEGKFKHTITTTGGTVLVFVHGSGSNSAANNPIQFDVWVDGVQYGGDDGVYSTSGGGTGNARVPVGFVLPVFGLAAGSHSFELRWKVTSGTAKLHAGAGTSGGGDIHSGFYVREMG